MATIQDLARAVIRGEYGNGQERRDRLGAQSMLSRRR